MSLEPMSYKNYTWAHNPKTIKISREKNLREFLLPFSGNAVQNLGYKKRVVRGQGEFFGSDCMEQFQKLWNVFEENNSGYLTLPGVPPFLVYFSSLELNADAKPNVISYSFEFWEDMKGLQPENIYEDAGYHTIISGETLWSIALKYDVSIETLLKLNSIKRPDLLTSGERLRIS